MDRRDFLKGTAAAAAVSITGAGLPAFAKLDEFAALDGMAQAGLVRAGQVTPLELVDAAIARIERLNPKLNAVVFKTFEKAREQAASAAIPSGPFRGVPYLIKDLSGLKGEPLTYGSRLFARNKAKKDDADVERAKEAGFVMVGKSNTPEFGLLPTTESMLLGNARNPWNTEYHTGGSSGGAAAAVAAGLVPCANGGDGGGSIRIPASVCGIVGLKVSRGRLYETQGSSILPVSLSVRMGLSRSVRDTAQLLNIGEIKDGSGAHSAVGFVDAASTRRLKIGFYTETGIGTDAESDVRSTLEETAELCRGLGHEVIASAPPFDARKMEEHFMALWSAIAVQVVKNTRLVGLRQWRWVSPDDVLEPWTIGLAEYFEKRENENPGQLERAVTYLAEVQQQYREYFEQVDVVLTPVLRKPPLKIGELSADLPFEEMYQGTLDYAVYTGPYNYAGNCAISLPLGQSASGLPIGSQFAAKSGNERTLLELAYELEQAKPWADNWAAYSAVKQ